MPLASQHLRTLLAGAPLVCGAALSMAWVLIAGSISTNLLASLATAQAAAVLIALLGRLGVENRLLRSVVSADPEAPMLLKHAMVGTLGLSAISVAVLLSARGFGATGYPWTPLMVGALTAPAVSTVVLCVELLKAKPKPVTASMINSLGVPTFMTAACLLFLVLAADSSAALDYARVLLVPGSYVFAAALGLVAIGGVPTVRGQLSARGALLFARSTTPFLVTTLTNQLYAGSVVAIASLLLADDQIASLVVAIRASTLPSMALVVVGYTHVPRLMRRGASIADAYKDAVIASIALGLPAALFVALISFWSERTTILPAIPTGLLLILLVGQTVAICFGPIGLALVAFGAEVALAGLSLISLVVLLLAVSSSALLFGAVGVAAAVSISISVQNLGAFAIYRRKFDHVAY